MFSIKKPTINSLENIYSIFTKSGSIDTTFGPNKDGKVVTDINNNINDYALSLQLDTNHIYLGGYTNAGSNLPILL